jgi:hypothetical protein
LVLGGGGYTVKNVAKTWTLETSILCGRPLDPSEKIDLSTLTFSGALFETSPCLLVPSDDTNRALPGFSVARSMNKIFEQIDRHAEHITPV